METRLPRALHSETARRSRATPGTSRVLRRSSRSTPVLQIAKRQAVGPLLHTLVTVRLFLRSD